jgi:hypothetical protein
MAYITITGDSDGDLHDAEMHNSKFGAIASVLNGNIDLENLTNPKSSQILLFTINGESGTDTGKNAFYPLTSETAGDVNGTSWSNASGTHNVLKSSWFKTPVSASLGECRIMYVNSTVPTSGEDFQVLIQKSSSTTITDSYSTIGTFTNDFYGSIGIANSAISLSTSTLDSGYYLRVVLKNPSGTFTTGDIPPGIQISLHYKVDHTS